MKRFGYGVIVCAALLAAGCTTMSDGGFVRASGEDLVLSKTGEKVMLRGVNVGGWLMTENWMCPTAHNTNKIGRCQYEIEDALIAKFGAEKTEALYDVYRDNWLRAEDFKNIRALGLNTIRLPFGWRELITRDGKPIEKGFGRIDWFLDQCERNGLYAILDMHGVPGSQNGRDHSGEVREHTFTSDPAMQDLCEKLWLEIANRYRDREVVAGYDLMNEPEGAPGGNTSTNGVMEICDRLYRSIRNVDTNHLIFVEACWEPQDMVPPSKFGWKNVCYQYHFYEWGKKTAQEINAGTDRHVKVEKTRGHKVPMLVGEFNLFDPEEAWAYGLDTYNKQGWHWTIWTYKVIGKKTNWGLYHGLDNKDPSDNVTVDDDYETIRAKWSRVRTSENFQANEYTRTVKKFAEAL